ncbi:MAG: DNA-binding protein WhiA [Synergistaceae bacterium]|nr:DNA-binding protein WhiA [Synergistaceae bacterium]
MSVSNAQNLWLSKLWDEWLTSPVISRSNADAEVSGLLLGMRRKNNTFTTNRLHVARRLSGPGKVRLWPLTSYSEKFELSVSMLTSPSKKPSVKFTCPHEILVLPRTLKTSWSWLKGLWGSTGGLYFPKSGYYLTLIISDEYTSSVTRKILSRTGLTWIERRNEFMLRNHEDIMTFLYGTGMEGAALDFEERTIIRSAKNKANIASNYDTANIARSVKASAEQLRLARKIISSGKLEALPEKLREVIILRLKYPDETLEGLGKKLVPQIGKSAVKYRWTKIQKITDEKLQGG